MCKRICSSILDIFVVSLVSSMFAFVVIAITASVTNGACPEADRRGIVNCNNQDLTTIPDLSKQAIIV